MRHSASLLFLTALPVIAQMPCERLRLIALSDTAVTSAEEVAAGVFRFPGTPAGAPGPGLPVFCRVAMTLKPSADSDIKAEVWMPLTAEWNGKLLSAGGGGFVGSISYGAMAAALRDGYATASTDTGHVGGNATFALGHPEKIVDFAYRAVHEMTVKAKAILTAYYGRPARYSYWQGCSTGGRQGLMEAQRYPEDYDGIIAGAPANNQIHLCAWRMALLSAVIKDPARALSPAKIAVVHDAILAKCDALDGVKDGLLEDPRQCRFEPETLLCRGSEQESCLTAGQVATVKMAFTDIRKKNGEFIYPGLVPSSETGWLLPGNAREPGGLDVGMFQYIGRQDANWDWRTFDLEADLALAVKNGGFMEATDPNLAAFKARGGKLLIYHGWADGGSGGAISPVNTLNYYSSVLTKMGPNQSNWLRVFMVPGMQHCGGGPGPNQFNAVAALERWRESGVAPDSILAARVVENRVERTRPVCPFPQVAVYKGTGSINDAGNFTCKVK
ncbi:MAG: tannase/feruloyl esterase family alpha/beta hydrolase [Acidobacteria bacterium]|nr:tannase/feruloyl esterase family alpha/beta hydrolase [Acidobacteriota bacterium]